MLIKTFGKTAEAGTPTREQIVSTMNLITTVHRNKGEHEYLCPYFYAKEITVRVMERAVFDKVAAKAGRMDRMWRARRKLAGV